MFMVRFFGNEVSILLPVVIFTFLPRVQFFGFFTRIKGFSLTFLLILRVLPSSVAVFNLYCAFSVHFNIHMFFLFSKSIKMFTWICLTPLWFFFLIFIHLFIPRLFKISKISVISIFIRFLQVFKYLFFWIRCLTWTHWLIFFFFIIKLLFFFNQIIWL